MKRSSIVTLVAGLWLLAPLALAQNAAPPEKTGLRIGEQAPAIMLKDQSGKERTLDDLRAGGEYVALVFYRSASW